MIVEELSKFIVNLEYEAIPKVAIDKAKLCFLDFLGVSNRGFCEDSVQILLKSLNEISSFNNNYNSYNSQDINYPDTNRCSIIGDGYSNIYDSGFINGVSAHVLDLDDGHRVAQLHPGCVVFSSALSVSEAINVFGKKFIEAVICGYEVAVVLGILVNPYHRNQGFHSTGTIGTFAAGATVSKLLQLDLEKTINVLGLCGTLSSGLLESNHQGTMGKQLHAGKAVYNGILTGYLGKNGFIGAESIIDGDEGFLKAMSTSLDLNKKEFNVDTYLLSYLKKSIGKFHINEVYFKKYPFCRHLHSSIDATLNINNKFNFNIDDIENITIKTYNIAAEHNNYSPQTKENIKQSLPHAVATAIVKNNLDIIENNPYDDNTFKQTLNKINIEKEEDFNEIFPKYRPSKVIIETKNETYEDYIELPLGESETPFSKEEILKKFKNLNPNFDLKKLDTIDNLEIYNIYEFMKNFH